MYKRPSKLAYTSTKAVALVKQQVRPNKIVGGAQRLEKAYTRLAKHKPGDAGAPQRKKRWNIKQHTRGSTGILAKS